MKKLPIKYYKLSSLKIKYEDCIVFKDKFYRNELSLSEKVALFNKIKSLFNFYWKYLQYLYKTKEVQLYTPVEIFKKARKDKLINNADIWLQYVNDFNIYWQENDENKQQQITQKMLDKYYKHIELINQFISTPENLKYLKENKHIEQEIMKDDLVLNSSDFVRNQSELDITKESYNKLIAYFKSNGEIKTVWAHGSRLYKTHTRGSDLDLLIDCPPDKWQGIYRGLINIPIPYIIDARNINYAGDIEYIKSIMYLGTKVIYKTDITN